MQDAARGSVAVRERESVQGVERLGEGWVALALERRGEGPGGARESGPWEARRRSDPTPRISGWQLSIWRSLARRGKIAVASSGEPVSIERPEREYFRMTLPQSAYGFARTGAEVEDSRFPHSPRLE